jgi:Protein of unknown function (DUF1569)
MNPSRRILLVAGSIAGGAVVAGGAAWLTIARDERASTVPAILEQLARFKSAKIAVTGSWSAAQVFTHMAQSVEFSMSGFPQQNSALFQATVGRAAFAAFEAKNRMRHNLLEPIPGASPLLESTTQAAALERLTAAFEAFAAFKGELQPHFAYGQLSKRQFEAAHALHVYNHLQEFKVTAAVA